MGNDKGFREKVIIAYQELAAIDGVTNITYQKVARKAGVAFGTVRYHFADADIDLEQAAILHSATTGQIFIESFINKRRLEKDFDPVQAYITGTFKWIKEDYRGASFLIHFYYLTTTKKKLSIDNTNYISTAQSRIRSLIFEGSGQGLYKLGLGLEETIIALHSSLLGGCIMALTEKNLKKTNTYESAISQQARVLLGIASQP